MFTRQQLQKYIDDGLISEQVHPENENVCIYNYTQKCQYSQAWDEVTTRCRGLIYDWSVDGLPVGTDYYIGQGKQLSNPFPKFFNWEEHIAKGTPIPNEIPVVYEKLDGWLGILYWLDGKPWIATRGSFTSTGAVWATEWFRKNVNWDNPSKPMDRNFTVLFEIISPITKIVLNYDFEGLVVIGIRQIEKSFEHTNLSHMIDLRDGNTMRVASQIKVGETDRFDELKKRETSNEEGFVILFPRENLRLKIKFEEYKRLHKILTNVSPKSIWEAMRDGQSFNEMLKDVPDEFFKWVIDTANSIQDEYNRIEAEAKMEFHTALANMTRTSEIEILDGEEYTKEDWHFKVRTTVTRKEAAEKIKQMTNPSIGFSMLDGKDYSHIIWKLVKPKADVTFKQDE